MADDPPEFNARNSDPNTSHAAAKLDAAKIKDRATVWQLFFHADPKPFADFQMEIELGGTRNGKWRKRRSDLTRDGFLVEVGEIRNPNTKKMVKLWGVNHNRPKQPAQPTLFDAIEAKP